MSKRSRKIKPYKSKAVMPSAYEREVLTILIEECAEVVQRATKLLRFGRDEKQKGQKLTNAQRLSLELGDLDHMTRIAMKHRLVDPKFIDKGRDAKGKQLEKYMQEFFKQEKNVLARDSMVGDFYRDSKGRMYQKKKSGWKRVPDRVDTVSGKLVPATVKLVHHINRKTKKK